MSEDARLPATSWAVLGQLTFGEELSGYDLKRWADQSLAFFYWAPSQSQIYSELKRLETHGFVISRIERTHDVRSRRLYTITAAGQRAFEQWLVDPGIEPVVLKHPLLLRVWAAHNDGPDRLVPLIRRYIADLDERAVRAAAHAESARSRPEWRYPAIALEWSERYYRDEVRRLEWMIERLDADFEGR